MMLFWYFKILYKFEKDTIQDTGVHYGPPRPTVWELIMVVTILNMILSTWRSKINFPSKQDSKTFEG